MKIKSLFLCATLMAGSMASWAIPAKRGMVNYTQPDGTDVAVTLHGDESFGYYMSSDGYPLIANEQGTLCFAEISNGVARASKFAATNPETRPAAVKKWLTATPAASATINAMRVSAGKSTPQNLPPQSGLGLCTTTFPKTGKIKGLVILVEYDNIKFTLDDPYNYFNDMLNKDGFSDYKATGSAREYFLEASAGKFDADFDVYGPVKLPKKRYWYGASTAYSNDQHPEDMVVHAVTLLDDKVDFSQYDCDGDGVLDNVFVFYAGQGQNDGGPSECVWPHAWTLSATGKQFAVDGVLVDRYACSNEWQTSAGLPDGIGTFCHEFSHVMGLPDLYSTGGDDSKATPGEWSVMDYGPYLNDSRTPPTYSAYERNAMGWLDLEELTDAATVTLEDLKDSNKAYMVGTLNPNEFYLFENRQNRGQDEFLPHHGMLIWHVDFDQDIWDGNRVNNNPSHQYVDLIEANGSTTDASSKSWPGKTGNTSFTTYTKPAFNDWRGNPLPPVTGIEETADGLITFDFDGGDFVFDIPAQPEAVEVNPVSASLSWKAVDRAKGYLLSVYTKNESGEPEYLPGLNEKDMGEALHFTATGLSAETDYYAVVVAVSGKRRSEPSPELKITTPELSFPWFTPETEPASDITSRSFTARWLPVDGAEKYILKVMSTMAVEPYTNTASFGSFTFMLPKGWDFNEATSRYEDREYCGKASPAAKMTTDGSCITTKVYDHDVKSIKFWYRGVSTNTQCTLDIEGWADGEWTVISQLVSLSRNGEEVSIDDIPAGIRQVRFVYHRYGNGNLAIDDIEISLGGIENHFVSGYERLETGNVTSMRVENLPQDNDVFHYTVTAVDADGRTTLESLPRKVVVENTSLTAVESESSAVRINGNEVTISGTPGSVVNIYDVLGICQATVRLNHHGTGTVSVGRKGIHIIAFPGKTLKVAIK